MSDANYVNPELIADTQLPYYKSQNNDFLLAHGDTFKLLKDFSFKFDMIFADPPYFLSNGGISLQSGKVVCVDKGDWILDPFSGSSTTGIAACLCDRRFAGIEQSEEFCQMSKARREELDNLGVKADLKRHIVDFKVLASSGQLTLFDGGNDMVWEDASNVYGVLPFDTKPLVEQKKSDGKCFLTCYVRRNDEECDAFMMHQATAYTTTLKSKTKLAKATRLFPMVKGAVDGYYEILGSTIGEDKKVHFTLGKYTRLSDEWHNIYGKMKPWELLEEDECKGLCSNR